MAKFTECVDRQGYQKWNKQVFEGSFWPDLEKDFQ